MRTASVSMPASRVFRLHPGDNVVVAGSPLTVGEEVVEHPVLAEAIEGATVDIRWEKMVERRTMLKSHRVVAELRQPAGAATLDLQTPTCFRTTTECSLQEARRAVCVVVVAEEAVALGRHPNSPSGQVVAEAVAASKA